MVSKVERVNVRGRTKLTLYQKPFNSTTDYIEKDSDGNIIGMWANYFDTSVTPTDPSTPTPTPSPSTNILATITSSSSSIKVGGSYKTVTINFYDESNEDITSEFENAQFEWHFNIEGTEYSDVIYSNVKFNQIKIKLPDDLDLIGNVLSITCTVFRDDIGYVHSNELQISITE